MTDEAEPTSPARRRRTKWWALAAILLAGAAFVAFWFQPQKLLLDDRVDEALPPLATGTVPADTPEDSSAPPEDSTAPPADAQGPATLATGSFISLDHPTTGSVRVLQLADGSRIVRLDELMTDNGPDLFVYLSTNPADGSKDRFDDDFVNLGRLKGNQGNQNYDLPASVDLSRYAALVIWCDRFNSAFGAAPLEPA